MADVTTQNFFQDAVLASLLHEDPRYFRRGSEYGMWNRVGYALSRVVITRTDKGTNRFNFSGMLGMGLGIGLSNAYYPDSSVNGEEVATRFGTSLLSNALEPLPNSGRIFVRNSFAASLGLPLRRPPRPEAKIGHGCPADSAATCAARPPALFVLSRHPQRRSQRVGLSRRHLVRRPGGNLKTNEEVSVPGATWVRFRSWMRRS